MSPRPKKPTATEVITFNELLAIYRESKIPMRRRIETAQLMLAYESPGSEWRGQHQRAEVTSII
jgi:hypothetical protein